MALDYVDLVYRCSEFSPASGKYNLGSQLERAATSIVLNIAKGSTGQSNAEQNRFLGLSMRSYLETIAGLDIIKRGEYLSATEIDDLRNLGHQLFIKLQAFRNSLKNKKESRGT